MFGKFGKKHTSFHNVTVDSGSYIDVDVSTTGSINNIALLNGTNNEVLQRHRNTKNISSSSLFSSPFLETTWTTWNGIQFIIYMILSSFLPFYWRIIIEIYDYPLTLISIELIISIIILLIYNIIRYHCCFESHPKAKALSITMKSNDNIKSDNISNFFTSSSKGIDDNKYSSSCSIRGSFIRYFCCKFWLKLRLIVYPSAFLALNIVVNSGYYRLKAKDIFVLFGATSIIYLVILSPFLLTDYPSKTSVISALTITFGAICFSWNGINTNNIGFIVILCNLLSSIFEPFHILFLRRSSRILTHEESETRKMDGIDVMTKSEMTLFYIICGLIILLPFTVIFEGKVSWKYIYNNNCDIHLILIGCCALLCHEWNMVLLTSNVEPLVVGIAQQSQVLWRYVVAMFLAGMCPYWQQPRDLFDGNYVILHWFGLMSITLGLVFYCYLKAKNTHVTNINIFKWNH